jgi:carbon-monoxide dehydrogenase medium subunit
MYSVTYQRATSVADAAAKAKSGDAKYLSGGMTLIPTMKQRLASPSVVVDLAHIAEMKGIKVGGGTVTIGAGTTHAEVATDAALKKAVPAVAHLASHIGDPHVRHRGTIGGSIANNDPAADYPSALLALDATIVTDKREIAAADFLPASSRPRWRMTRSSRRCASRCPPRPATRSSRTRPRVMPSRACSWRTAPAA